MRRNPLLEITIIHTPQVTCHNPQVPSQKSKVMYVISNYV